MTETLKEALQKLHDICKGNHTCKTCPLNSEVSTCFAGMPPVAWTDKEIGKIIEAVQTLKKVNACSECEFFNDSRFYADNSILVSWGSCMKCQRNMTTTDPYHEIPTWCPLKGREDGNNTGND